MTIKLVSLPYDEHELEPFITKQTIQFHYHKHHAGYVQKVNELIENTDMRNKSLEEIIMLSSQSSDLTGLFNQSAQVWNHTFYWNSLCPVSHQQPLDKELEEAINRDFGSVNALKEELVKRGLAQFGSGWVWLVKENNQLKVVSTSNAQTPLTNENQVPLLTIDVWEHAYYLDEQNKRADYLKNVVDHILNWDFAARNFKSV